MKPQDQVLRRRLTLAARAPGLDAAALTRLAAESPDFVLLEQPHPALLRQLGLTTRTISALLCPDEARIAADLRWLETSGCTLLACTSPDYPELLRRSPDP